MKTLLEYCLRPLVLTAVCLSGIVLLPSLLNMSTGRVVDMPIPLSPAGPVSTRILLPLAGRYDLFLLIDDEGRSTDRLLQVTGSWDAKGGQATRDGTALPLRWSLAHVGSTEGGQSVKVDTLGSSARDKDAVWRSIGTTDQVAPGLYNFRVEVLQNIAAFAPFKARILMTHAGGGTPLTRALSFGGSALLYTMWCCGVLCGFFLACRIARFRFAGRAGSGVDPAMVLAPASLGGRLSLYLAGPVLGAALVAGTWGYDDPIFKGVVFISACILAVAAPILYAILVRFGRLKGRHYTSALASVAVVVGIESLLVDSGLLWVGYVMVHPG